jgi:hypothetical protein
LRPLSGRKDEVKTRPEQHGAKKRLFFNHEFVTTVWSQKHCVVTKTLFCPMNMGHDKREKKCNNIKKLWLRPNRGNFAKC